MQPSTSPDNPTREFSFARPASIDDATYERIRFIRPLEAVVQPIIDHNMRLVESVQFLAPGYRGENDLPNHEPLSVQLNPNLNQACEMLQSFASVALRYRPGEFPSHCCKMRELVFTTRYLIQSIERCIDAATTENAMSHMAHFFFCLDATASRKLSSDDWGRRLHSRLAAMVKSFGEISDALRLRERQRNSEIDAKSAPPATAEDVGAAADRISGRIDAAKSETVRAVRRAKREIIKDAHAEHRSEADLRLPKGERGRQIAAVRNAVRAARAAGRKPSLLRICNKTWQNIKGGYPSAAALYQYCHRHFAQF